MKSWKLAIVYFLCGYLIATLVGFGTYYLLSENAMWIIMMTFMPVFYIFLCYRYFSDARCANYRYLDSETIRLTILWILLSFVLDTLVYVFITPLVMGFPINSTFFLDQSPWIWLNYASVILIVAVGKYIYYRKSNRKLIKL